MHKIALQEGEHIVEVIRRHWIVYVSEAAFMVLAVITPILFVIVIIGQANGLAAMFPVLSSLFSGSGILLLALALVLWILLAWVFFFIVWTHHYLDIWIITNKRIIDIDQIALFSREVTSFRIDKIQEINIETHGILASMLGFGTIEIQTAGETPNLKIANVPDPEHAREEITKIHDSIINVQHPAAVHQQV